jgi:hypothetical protein
MPAGRSVDISWLRAKWQHRLSGSQKEVVACTTWEKLYLGISLSPIDFKAQRHTAESFTRIRKGQLARRVFLIERAGYFAYRAIDWIGGLSYRTGDCGSGILLEEPLQSDDAETNRYENGES